MIAISLGPHEDSALVPWTDLRALKLQTLLRTEHQCPRGCPSKRPHSEGAECNCRCSSHLR